MKHAIIKTSAALSIAALLAAPSLRGAIVAVEVGDDVKAAVEGASLGDVVELAAGTHSPTGEIAVPAGVTVRGAGRTATVVSGAGLTSRAFCVTNAESRLESFTISGYTNTTESAIAGGKRGGAIYMTAGTLDDLLVTFNKYGLAQQGGGVYFSGRGMVTNCVVSHNVMQGRSNGCGIYAEASVGAQIVIADCVVEDNWFDAKNATYTCSGGGIYANRKVLVLRCVVRRNGNRNISALGRFTGYGDGIYAAGYDVRNIAVVDGCLVADNAQTGVHLNGLVEMRNCIVCGHGTVNKSGQNISAGVTAKGGNNKIYNCTIYGNAIDQAGSGLWLDGAETAVNNIVWGNGILGDVHVSPSATFSTNIVGTAVSSGVGNRVADPLFRDAAGGDFTIASAASPAVDNGAQIASFAADFAGRARPEGAGWDIGAHERPYNPDEKTLTVVFDSPAQRHAGDAVAAHAAVAGVDAEGIASVSWFANGSAVAGADGLSLSLPSGDYAAGELALRCVLTLADSSTLEGSATRTISVAPTDVYVSNTGSATYPYDSWEKATPDLAAAIAAAVPAPDATVTAHVAAGDYAFPSSNLDIILPVHVVGAGSGATSFDCSGFAGQALFFIGQDSLVSGATFDGGGVAKNNLNGTGLFMVRGGTLSDVVAQGFSAYGSSIVYVESGLVTNATIRDNIQRSGGNGFAMRLKGGEASDCVITNNTANKDGYGICAMGIYIEGPATARRCLVAGNFNRNSEHQYYESNLGAGVRLNHADALVDSCTIISNGFSNVYLDRGGTLRNCLVTGGRVSSRTEAISGGVTMKNGNLYNCTIAGNANLKNAAYGDLVMTGGTARNNIAALATQTGGTAANNLFSADPRFRNAAALDFHLTGASALAIDKGDSGAWAGLAQATDLDGNPRLFGLAVDLGCYEVQTARRTIMLLR